MLESNGVSKFGDFEVLQKPWLDFDKAFYIGGTD
jgi:hypothetical protein